MYGRFPAPSGLNVVSDKSKGYPSFLVVVRR